MRSGDSRELVDVLRQSQALVRAIVAALPPSARTAVPHVEGYQVLERLGEGGMGSVWRAIQLSTKREVALKVIGAGAVGPGGPSCGSSGRSS